MKKEDAAKTRCILSACKGRLFGRMKSGVLLRRCPRSPRLESSDDTVSGCCKMDHRLPYSIEFAQVLSKSAKRIPTTIKAILPPFPFFSVFFSTYEAEVWFSSSDALF